FDCLADVVVAKRRHDMKTADDGVHLVDPGHLLSLLDGVDHAAMATRCQDDQTLALDKIVGCDLMIEIIGDIGTGVLRPGHFLWETAETIENANNLASWQQRLFERCLPDPSAGEGVIGNDGGAFRHHQHEIRIEDRFAIERTELTAGGGATDAKGVLSTDEERNFSLEPVPIGCKESH